MAVAALALFLGYRFLETAVAVSTPFVAALVIALLCDPVVIQIQKSVGFTKGKRAPAVVLVFVFFLLAFAALIVLVVPSLIAQIGKLIEWVTGNGLGQLQTSVNDWLQNHRKIGPVALPDSINSLVQQYYDQAIAAAKQVGPKL